MIFKQWQAVLRSDKTQIRRLVGKREACHDGMSVAKTWTHVVLGTTGHRAWVPYYPKWQVGRTYAVQPGRGQPAVMYKIDPSGGILSWDWGRADPRVSVAETKQQLATLGWREGRIRITQIRRERVQDISEEDAIAEGIYLKGNRSGDSGWVYDLDGLLHIRSKWAFKALWNSIHKKPGIRWAGNPEVWVLTFESV